MYGEWCEAEIRLLAQVLKPGDAFHQCSHHAPRDEPGLVHVVMARPLAIVLSGWRILFERRPWSVKPRANLWAHHGGA
jgi:hypothetical protein